MRIPDTDGGRQEHTLPRDEETKRGVRTLKTDGGRQKHTLPRDEETVGGLRTENTHEAG